MTYNEAFLFIERIKDTAIGSPVKGRLIESLFIGPTNRERLTEFLNLRIKVGDEPALLDFSSRGISLSVYGVSVTMISEDVPRWDMTVIDDFELILSN